MARESQGKLRTEREQPIEKVKDLAERKVNGKREQRKQEGKPNTKYPGELENEGASVVTHFWVPTKNKNKKAK